MRDDFATQLQAMPHQKRIVLGSERIHGNGGFDAVLLQHLEHAKDADTVAILAMRPRRDVGKRSPAVTTGEI